MFNPSASAWLVIDAGNSAVPRVVVPSLTEGLGLVGKGRVAALVGHLRDGVGVVDQDVPGEFGHLLAAEIADWLRRRGCWVLERPSGGAKGRWHVFFAHRDFQYAPAASRTGLAAEITAYLVGLAAEVKVPAHELDLRDAVRPLSSPHRYGAMTRPKGDLREALRSLRRVHADLPESAPLRRRPKVHATGTAAPLDGHLSTGSTVVPLLLQRWKRELRPDWRRYLMTGVIPAGSWAAAATKTRAAVTVDRSLVEATCSRELVWAVGDPRIAWQLIRESHPTAMTKTKHQGWSWWIRYVWNKAVLTASEFNPTPQSRPADAAPDEVIAAVAVARADLNALMWTVPVRQRPALLLVGHHVLDRVASTGSLRVPCPERDLLLDTGLGDRKTIRHVLRLLDGRLGTLHTDCLSLTQRDSTSYEFEIKPAAEVEGRQIPPPALHPPPTPRGLWATLPRTSHSLWRTLETSAAPSTLAELAAKAGLTQDPGEEPSKSQRATAKTALAALSRAGLATCDEEGLWRTASRPRSVEIEKRAAAAHARQLEIVEAERAAYRGGATSTWTAGRARAIKAQMAKEKGWWDNLSPVARAERTEHGRLKFDQMSISQQASLKASLAERRIRAGLDELDQYQTWLTRLPADEYVARSLERKERFQDLSRAERVASVTAWDRHRLRYGLTSQRLPTPASEERRLTGEQAALLPDGADGRDAVFLERQGQLHESVDHRAAG